jgi:serine/threonine protein kinase
VIQNIFFSLVHELVPIYALLCNCIFPVLQISDFGLAKLVVRSSDAEASVTKVVGTFGYLAPE